MCDIVEIDGKTHTTLASLRRTLGGEPVVPDSDKQNFPPDCCLCVVDLEATAKAYGFTLKAEAGWNVFQRSAVRRSGES